MRDRRSFVAWLGSLPLVGRPRPLGAVPPIVIDATPTALYQQPDGRNNLVRVAVMGLDAPAARARVTDRRGTLVGTAGLLPTGASLAGELWVPLSRAVGAEFQIDVEVGKQRVGSRRVRLAPPRRWTRSEEHTSELQSQSNLVCRLLLEKKKKKTLVTIE